MRTFSWLLVLILGFALAGHAANPTHQMYSATAVAEIRFSGAGCVSNVPYESTYLENTAKKIIVGETAYILSTKSLDSIVHKLKLNRTWAQRFNSNAHDLSEQETIRHLRSAVRIDFPGGNSFIKSTFDVRSTTTPFWYLEYCPLIFKITAYSEVPQEAADIANGVVDNYKAMRDQEEADRTKHGLDTLRDQITEQQKVVDDTRAPVEKLRQQLNGEPLDIPENLDQDANMHERDLLEAQEDYEARRVLQEKVINLPNDQFIAALRGLQRLPESYSDPAHPPGKEEIARLRQEMQTDTETAKSRVVLLQKEVDDLTAKLRPYQTPQLEPFRRANRQFEQQQAILDALNIRLTQIIADQDLAESPVRIISRAEPPPQ